MATPDKAVLGLLNGLAKREYYDEEGITDDFLHEELYSDINQEEFSGILKRFQGLLTTLATSDMNFSQLEAYLTSQMRRRETSQNLTESQASSVMKFWRSHKAKIHNAILGRNRFSSQLKAFNWRIDFKSQERSTKPTSDPCVVVEMQTNDTCEPQVQSQRTVPTEIVFEMDLEQVNGLVKSLDHIEQKIGKFCEESPK